MEYPEKIHNEGKDTLPMKEIYTRIWEAAKPHYLKGRPMDVDHIEWMMEEATRISEVEHLDETVLLPLAILHDIGYAKVPSIESTDYNTLDIRKLHMEEGAKLAKTILETLDYPQEKIEKIVSYVAMHDQWAYGEVDAYINDPILGTFKDLDYLWIYAPKGREAFQKLKNFSNEQMLKHLQDETSPIFNKKPFSNDSTKRMHDELLDARTQELS